MSIASDEIEVTANNQTVTIDKTPLSAAAARVTHWVVERTLDGGSVYFPVNMPSAAPNGTAIATGTYADSTTDRLLRQRTALRNDQGVPNPYRVAAAEIRRLRRLSK